MADCGVIGGDAPHLHMLNLIAGGIPASLESYRRLGGTVPADAAGQHVQGAEPDTLLSHPSRCWARVPGRPR